MLKRILPLLAVLPVLAGCTVHTHTYSTPVVYHRPVYVTPPPPVYVMPPRTVYVAPPPPVYVMPRGHYYYHHRCWRCY